MHKIGGTAGDPPSNTEMTVVAQRYTGLAISELWQILRKSQSDSARVAAAAIILDRAYGKPSRTSKEDWLSKSVGRLSVKQLLND